jgi:hypothetical protein
LPPCGHADADRHLDQSVRNANAWSATRLRIRSAIAVVIGRDRHVSDGQIEYRYLPIAINCAGGKKST